MYYGFKKINLTEYWTQYRKQLVKKWIHPSPLNGIKLGLHVNKQWQELCAHFFVSYKTFQQEMINKSYTNKTILPKLGGGNQKTIYMLYYRERLQNSQVAFCESMNCTNMMKQAHTQNTYQNLPSLVCTALDGQLYALSSLHHFHNKMHTDRNRSKLNTCICDLENFLLNMHRSWHLGKNPTKIINTKLYYI